MPTVMQEEVLKCLSLLEIQAEKTVQSIDITLIKEHYLKLAQKYHPDAVASRQEELKDDESPESKFVEIKEAFDKLVEINSEFGGSLLIDPEAEMAAQLEKELQRKRMHELRMKMAKARFEQKKEE